MAFVGQVALPMAARREKRVARLAHLRASGKKGSLGPEPSVEHQVHAHEAQDHPKANKHH